MNDAPRRPAGPHGDDGTNSIIRNSTIDISVHGQQAWPSMALHQACAQHVLDVAVHVLWQRHCGDAARARHLIERQASHSLLLILPRDR